MKQTCEHCIHFSSCCYMLHDNEGNWIICDEFKDKNKYIYVPFLVGDTSYVVTKCSYSSPYEVIKCTVTKTNLKKDMHFLITCQGRYANGSWYNGSLSSKSLGKTIFLSQWEAKKRCGMLNAKKDKT